MSSQPRCRARRIQSASSAAADLRLSSSIPMVVALQQPAAATCRPSLAPPTPTAQFQCCRSYTYRFLSSAATRCTLLRQCDAPPSLPLRKILVLSLTTNLSPLPAHVAALCAHVAAHVVAALATMQPASPPAEDKRARKPSENPSPVPSTCYEQQTAGTDCSAAFAPVQCPSRQS
jgi:hypothetical protein